MFISGNPLNCKFARSIPFARGDIPKRTRKKGMISRNFVQFKKQSRCLMMKNNVFFTYACPCSMSTCKYLIHQSWEHFGVVELA